MNDVGPKVPVPARLTHFAASITERPASQFMGNHWYVTKSWAVLCACGEVFEPHNEQGTDSRIIGGEEQIRAHIIERSALIAAAPELYEALRRLADVTPNGLCWCATDTSTDLHTEECIAARTALTKAEGPLEPAAQKKSK